MGVTASEFEIELKAIVKERNRAIRGLMASCKARGVKMDRQMAAAIVGEILMTQRFAKRGSSGRSRPRL